MIKQIPTLFSLVTLGISAQASVIVHDPGLAVQDAAHEVVNLAKYAVTATKQTETALNTLNTYENTVLQVARMGNPAALRSLPGVSTVAGLYQIYGQLSRDYVTAKALLNPQRYRYDMNYILWAYRLPQWNGFNSANGLPVLPAQGLFQFQTGSWNLRSKPKAIRIGDCGSISSLSLRRFCLRNCRRQLSCSVSTAWFHRGRNDTLSWQPSKRLTAIVMCQDHTAFCIDGALLNGQDARIRRLSKKE